MLNKVQSTPGAGGDQEIYRYRSIQLQIDGFMDAQCCGIGIKICVKRINYGSSVQEQCPGGIA
jgi:hypothetical protein